MTDPTTTADIDGRLLQRVRALLAKAEATAFPEEAAAFTAKAHELMAAHAIDQAMLDARHGDQVVTSVRIVLHPPYVKDRFLLLGAVADPNRCRAILGIEDGPFKNRLLDDLMDGVFTDNRHATVFGHRRDLDVVETLFTSLLLQATNALTNHGSVTDEWGRNQTRAFRHSFLVSFAATIRDRLTDNDERATAAADATHGGDVLPLLADRRERVDASVADAFPHTRPLTTSVSNHDGLEAGHRAGRRADVGATRVGALRRQLAWV